MSRGLWFAAGAGAGVWAMVRGRRAAEVLTVDGLRDRVHTLGLGVRMLRDEVATGRSEKETELRASLGLTRPGRPGRPELTGGRHRGTSEPPAAPDELPEPPAAGRHTGPPHEEGTT